MKNLLLLCVFLNTLLTFSQNFEISGTLKDELQNPIESATLYLESIKDSTMITYTISDSNGAFNLSGNTKSKNLRFVASYSGMQTITKVLNISEELIDLKELILKENSELLNEVVIVSEKSPITIKKDTLQFNADSFKTGSDANAESLLKKLPGVVVDKDGSIKVNGKPVNKILVNGKEFFGSDLTIATKNLPKEIIDKIQVVDTKTKDESFTGEEGDKENKTINITIKKDKNKGFFGRANLGYGTDDRYSVSGILNYFNNEERLSVLGGSNNVNTAGFNKDDVNELRNNSSGITQTSSIGVNYNNEWNKTADLGTDYIFNQTDTETGSNSRVETFLPDETSFLTVSDQNSQRFAERHNFNLDFEIKPDTLTRISVTPSFTKSNGDLLSNRSQVRSNNIDGQINNSNSNTSSNYNNFNSNFRASISRKFKVPGESVSLWLRSRYTNNISEDFFKSNIDYSDVAIEDENINQLKVNDQSNNFFNSNLRLTRLISGNWFYNLSVRTEINNSKVNRATYDFSEITKDYTNINDNLTNNVKTNTTILAPSAGIRFRKDKLSVRLNLGYNATSLKNNDLLSKSKISNNFNSLNFRASLWKQIKQGNSIWTSISNRAGVPDINQLQPIIDNQNPLNTVIGNPDLKASNTTSVAFSYRDFNMKSKSGYNFYIQSSLTDNQSTARTFTDPETLKRVTTYENVNGNIWGYFSSGYNKKHQFDKHDLSYNIDLIMNYRNSVSFSNEEKLKTQNLSLQPYFRLTYNYDDLIEFSPYYRYNYSLFNYSIDLGQETNYANSRFGLNLDTFWPKNIEFSNDFSISNNPNVAEGFTKTVYMWNASLGVKMLKDKGLLKLKVFDLLNQNTSVSRYSNNDFISDTENLVLKQYFMLSFTYKVNKIGGKK